MVEVLTPAGNWSSWPPHKHDTDDMPNEAILEEIYHYRFRRSGAWGSSGSTGATAPVTRDGQSVTARS